MKNTKFLVVAATAAMLLTACKPAEITQEQASARLANISKAYETTETIPEVNAMEIKASNTTIVANKESKTNTYFALSLKDKISEAYVEVNGQKTAHIINMYKDGEQYVVNMLNKTYAHVKLELPKFEASLKVDAKTQLGDFSGQVIATMGASVETNKDEILKELQSELETLKNDFLDKCDINYYSDGEGSLEVETDVKYSLDLALNEQSISKTGYTYLNAAFDNYLPSKLVANYMDEITTKLNGKTTNIKNGSETNITFNYNAHINEPNLDGFKG